MAITICTVSGKLRDNSGTAVVGATVSANLIKAYVHPSDNSLIVPYEVSTTTAADGSWSLALAETTTPQVSITITFFFPTGLNATTQRLEYPVIIPNSASATFASLVTSTP